jgi:hypothetical protein
MNKILLIPIFYVNNFSLTHTLLGATNSTHANNPAKVGLHISAV